jgi:hypothetical protein
MRRPPWLYIVWCLCSCRVACPHSPAAWPHSAVSLAAVLLRLMLWSEPVFVGGVGRARLGALLGLGAVSRTAVACVQPPAESLSHQPMARGLDP